MSFFEQLKQRNVIRLGIAYSVGSWVLVEVASVILPAFNAPEWILRALVLALILVPAASELAVLLGLGAAGIALAVVLTLALLLFPRRLEPVVMRALAALSAPKVVLSLWPPAVARTVAAPRLVEL